MLIDGHKFNNLMQRCSYRYLAGDLRKFVTCSNSGGNNKGLINCYNVLKTKPKSSLFEVN